MKVLLICLVTLLKLIVVTSSTDQALERLSLQETQDINNAIEKMRNKRAGDLSFIELVNRFEKNFKDILKNPSNLDPYLNIVNDSTYNYVKFFFE